MMFHPDDGPAEETHGHKQNPCVKDILTRPLHRGRQGVREKSNDGRPQKAQPKAGQNEPQPALQSLCCRHHQTDDQGNFQTFTKNNGGNRQHGKTLPNQNLFHNNLTLGFVRVKFPHEGIGAGL